MLKKVCQNNALCFNNLSQQYEAEFAVLTGKKPDRQGLYQITVPDDSHEGYLFYDEGDNPLGFAVVDISKERFDMAEFYVVPAIRRSGVGHEMACALFDSYPGLWQVRQIEGADHAYEFWVRVIAAYSEGRFTDRVEPDWEWGEVRIQRFANGAGIRGTL